MSPEASYELDKNISFVSAMSGNETRVSSAAVPTDATTEWMLIPDQWDNGVSRLPSNWLTRLVITEADSLSFLAICLLLRPSSCRAWIWS